MKSEIVGGEARKVVGYRGPNGDIYFPSSGRVGDFRRLVVSLGVISDRAYSCQYTDMPGFQPLYKGDKVTLIF